MKGVSLSVVLFYVLYCSLGKEHLIAARILKRSPQLLKDIMEMFNKTETSKASGFQSSVRPVIVTDFYAGGHHLAEVFEDTNTSEAVGCNLIGSKELIERILRVIDPQRVKNMSKEEMDEFIDKCNDKEPTEEGSSLLDILGDAFHSLVIFPGTKWCGPGDVAKNYDDLGSASRTDSCCREHDHSGDNIPAFETKHNITNYLPYTMTECVYDRKFFNCLQNVSSFPSVTVGTLFFDVLNTKCFEYGHPTKCAERNFWRIFLLKDPCVKKEPDTSKPKEWHIESPPSFLEKFIEEKKQERSKNSSESMENEV